MRGAEQLPMEGSSFSALVKKHFGYLVNEYGFAIVHESYQPEMMGNAQVLFESTSVGISIVCDRNQVLISLGLLSQSQRDWLDLDQIVRVFAADIGAVYSFPEDFSNRKAALESQVSRLARIMRQYCAPVLKGNFSAIQARPME